MEKYRVEGRAAEIGPGEVIGLTKAQFEARRHNLEGVEPGIEDIQHRDDMVVCRVMALQQFKVGETVFLPYAPPRSMSDRLVLASEPAKVEAPVVKPPAKPRPPKPNNGKASKPTPAAARVGGDSSKASKPTPAIKIGTGKDKVEEKKV
jgi:hypothetical protein